MFFRPVLALAALSFVLPACKDQKGATLGSGIPRARVVEIADEDVAAPLPAADEAANQDLPEVKNNKSAEIGILCYHDFVTNIQPTQMRINIDHFRTQMEAIKEAKLPVISLKDFVDWRHGTKSIPDSSVMITIDDGYDSVYHLAAPILEEYGYPYTIYLYQHYVNGGGRALTTAMIKELLAKNATLGSHSVSHPLNIAKPGNRSPEEYEAFLNRELNDSKVFLEDLFHVPISTYAHPGGSYTQRILDLGPMFGYEFMFSVNPAKATFDSKPGLIPRYVVLGNDKADRNFHAALNFRGVGDSELGRQLIGELNAAGQPIVSAYPAPDSKISERSPLISVDVSQLSDIDPNTVVMRVAGIGDLEAKYDATTGRITAQIEETLRMPEVFVHVSFMREGADRPDVLSWKFSIDLVAYYLPQESKVAVPKAQPITN